MKCIQPIHSVINLIDLCEISVPGISLQISCILPHLLTNKGDVHVWNWTPTDYALIDKIKTQGAHHNPIIRYFRTNLNRSQHKNRAGISAVVSLLCVLLTHHIQRWLLTHHYSYLKVQIKHEMSPGHYFLLKIRKLIRRVRDLTKRKIARGYLKLVRKFDNVVWYIVK